MRGRYFNEELLTALRRNIAFYERVDLLIKISISAVLFLILYLSSSIKLAFCVLGVLLMVKTLSWLLVLGVRYALKKWCGSFFYPIDAGTAGDTIGRYSLAEINAWINEVCQTLQVSKPAELMVYESKYANAFAGQDRWFGVLKRNRIGILTNVFHLLDAEELRAVIVHEIAHHKHFPRAGVIAQLIIPLVTGRPVYRQCLEHLSDWYAAKTISVAAAANALIKLHHRSHLISEISRGLTYVQKDFNIGLAGIVEFQEIAKEVIPHGLKATETLDRHMIEIIDRYFARRSNVFRGVGQSYVAKYRRDKSLKAARRAVNARHKFIDWRIFDDRIKDNALDEQELEDLYLHLKNEPAAELFSSTVFRDDTSRKWSSHPALRDRLLFIIEAVPAASCVTCEPRLPAA